MVADLRRRADVGRQQGEGVVVRRVVLDPSGRFAFLVFADRPKAEGVADPRIPVAPMVAYFGTYDVNEDTKTLTYHVGTASTPAFNGKRADRKRHQAATPSPRSARLSRRRRVKLFLSTSGGGKSKAGGRRRCRYRTSPRVSGRSYRPSRDVEGSWSRSGDLGIARVAIGLRRTRQTWCCRLLTDGQR